MFKHEVTFGKDRYHLLDQMREWCRNTIGAGGYFINDHCVWHIITVFGNSTFSFKRESDATLFALRWA